MKTKDFTITEDNGKKAELTIKYPAPEDIEESNKIYGAKVASMVRDSGNKKPLLRKELDQFLRESRVWSDDDEKQIAKLQDDIAGKISKMKKGGLKLSEGRELAIGITDKRKEIVRIMSKRQIFDDTTIEAFAEAERNDYLVYACTVYAQDGEKYWHSFEDMKNDKLSEAYRKGAVLVYETIYDVNPEFEKNLPENKWLKKYGFLNENLEYVDRKTGDKVDREGNPVQEVSEIIERNIDNLQGDIESESPFIDDETNKPVVVAVESKEEEKPEDTKSEETKTETAAEVA